MNGGDVEPLIEVRIYCDDCTGSGRCLCATVDSCLAEMRIEARVTRFTHPLDRVSAGIPLAPALCINGRLLAMGSELSRDTVGIILLNSFNRISSMDDASGSTN